MGAVLTRHGQPDHRRAAVAAARLGFVARGIVYAMIGILAIELARGRGGANASQAGALTTLAHEPFGEVLVIAIAVGTVGYAVWRLWQGLAGTGLEDDRPSAGERVVAVVSGLVYLSIAGLALRVLTSPTHSAQSPKPSTTTSDVFRLPGGQEIVGIVGLILFIAGLVNIWRGIRKKFMEDARTGEMSATAQRWYSWLGTLGLVGRGVVFALVGVLLVRAAIDYKPSQAKGLDGALQTLANQPYGPALLIAVAVCLIAFGLYSVADARYRRL